MASADFPTNGHNGQPGPGQQLYGFRKRRMAPLKGLAAPEPTFSPMATVASQAQDSNYMVSESDGWHLALERPRRACADFFTNGHRGQPCPGQQLYGFRKRRKASPRLRRLSHQWPQWPARPRTAIIWFPNGQPGPGQPIIWFPKATDGTLKGLAAPEPIFPPMATVASQAQDSNYMVSESDGWHLALERPPRAYQWPQWPARPRTAIIWFPKATDGTSPLKGLPAPAPIFPPVATVASQAQDSNYI